LYRPSELLANRGNPAKAERVLGWKARLTMPGVIAEMVRAHQSGASAA
jgi:GDPmannose 4,6-dehydratase